MRIRLSITIVAVLAIAFVAAAPPVLGQQSGGGPGGADRGGRRLFQRFVEDAAIVPGGWIEGQVIYADLPGGDRTSAGPLIAFRLAPTLEGGLRFGLLDVDPDSGRGGSGFSDVDLYLKYRLPRGGAHRLAFGALIKAPTADEEEGLGTGKTDVEIFGAYRADLPAVTLVLNAGARYNGDPLMGEAENSLLLGGGILMPATPRLTFIIEGSFETERLEGGENDGRLTTGLQLLGKGGRGGFRGALALPLTDGAPDYEIILGALFTY
jgi:hypothetical protein